MPIFGIWQTIGRTGSLFFSQSARSLHDHDVYYKFGSNQKKTFTNISVSAAVDFFEKIDTLKLVDRRVGRMSSVDISLAAAAMLFSAVANCQKLSNL